MQKPPPPKQGYKLPLWDHGVFKNINEYRSTALAYLEREGVDLVENSNGFNYSKEELKSVIIGHPKNTQIRV